MSAMAATSHVQRAPIAIEKCSSTQRGAFPSRSLTPRRNNPQQHLKGRVHLAGARFLGDARAFQPRAIKIGANGPTRIVTTSDLNAALGFQPWQPGEIAGLVFFVGLSWATFSATTGVDSLLAQGNLETMKEKGMVVKNEAKVGSGKIYEIEDTD